MKNFGSEGRRGGAQEIDSQDNVIDEVIFKLEHIRDFKIIAPPNPTLLDPAIVSATNKSDAPQRFSQSKPEAKGNSIEEERKHY